MTLAIPSTTHHSLKWQAGDSSAAAHNYVGGQRLDSLQTHIIVNPANWSDTVGTVHLAEASTVDQAVEASARAFADWSATPVERRIEAVGAAIAAIAAKGAPDELGTLLTREQGKPLFEGRNEAGFPTTLFGMFSALAEKTLAMEELVDEKGRRLRGYVPVGPTVVITPWNWPVALSLVKVIPALLAGNTVTLKPASNTPLTISAMIEAMAEQLPPGVLNILHGGGELGGTLVAHPKVRKVIFVGSTETGRKIYAASASTIKRMTLELGGNDAAVLLDDVELNERNINLLLRAAFVTTGQVCWAVKRIYAPASRYGEVVEALTAAANGLIVGDGLDPSVSMGPLNNQNQYDLVGDFIAEARALGGTLTECGSVAGGTDWDNGYFRRPMIASNVPDSARLVAQEQFGPVLPIQSYDTVSEALARANGTEYGLCASVWGADEDRAFQVATGLEAGQVFVNCHAGPAIDFDSPFGGIKQSGYGRELGPEALYEFMTNRLYTNRLLIDF